jgi:hypothetical protein
MNYITSLCLTRSLNAAPIANRREMVTGYKPAPAGIRLFGLLRRYVPLNDGENRAGRDRVDKQIK